MAVERTLSIIKPDAVGKNAIEINKLGGSKKQR